MADRNYTAVFIQQTIGEEVRTIAALAFWEDDAIILPVPGFEQAALYWHRRFLESQQHGVSPEEFYQEWDSRNGVSYGFGPPDTVRASSAADACRKALGQHPDIGDFFDWDEAQEYGPLP